MQSSALPTPVKYTCVSYTWGRYRQKDAQGNRLPPFRIEGVPEWPVPTNSLFNVHAMSHNFDECRETLQLSRYYWFDLFCVPLGHDNESKMMRDRRESEIARQGEILRNAKTCIIQLNDRVGDQISQRPIR